MGDSEIIPSSNFAVKLDGVKATKEAKQSVRSTEDGLDATLAENVLITIWPTVDGVLLLVL